MISRLPARIDVLLTLLVGCMLGGCWMSHEPGAPPRRGGLEHSIGAGQRGLRGEARGWAEGEARGRAELLLKLLRLKFVELPESAVQRVRAASIDELDRWAERVLTAESLDELWG